MINLAISLSQRLKEQFPNIKRPRHSFGASTYSCIFCDERTEVNCVMSRIRGKYPQKIIAYCDDCEKNVEPSLTFDLIEYLSLPSDWIMDIELPEGYMATNLRLSRTVSPGEIIISGERDDTDYNDFLWSDFNERWKDMFRNIVADKEWPKYYPVELKEYFKDLKK